MMRFWKKKKPVDTCEHEWHLVNESLCSYELYCPKCKKSIFTGTRDDADSYIKKSQLRKEYLEKIREESRDTT